MTLQIDSRQLTLEKQCRQPAVDCRYFSAKQRSAAKHELSMLLCEAALRCEARAVD
jgi:hypothetical protein